MALCGYVKLFESLSRKQQKTVILSHSRENTGAKDPFPKAPPLPQNGYPETSLQRKCGPLGNSRSKLLSAVCPQQAFLCAGAIAALWCHGF